MKYFLLTTIMLTGCAGQPATIPKNNIGEHQPDLKYNLAVTILVRDNENKPLENIGIEDISTVCQKIPITDGETNTVIGYQEKKFPESWCNQQALNTKLITDGDGEAKAFFNLDPPPSSKNVLLDSWPFYATPHFSMKLEGLKKTAGSTALETNVWKADVLK